MYTKRELRAAADTIKEIARKNNVPEAQVRADMREAIRCAKASPDPAVRARWAAFHYTGVEPTVEEFILWTASMAKGRMGK